MRFGKSVLFSAALLVVLVVVASEASGKPKAAVFSLFGDDSYGEQIEYRATPNLVYEIECTQNSLDWLGQWSDTDGYCETIVHLNYTSPYSSNPYYNDVVTALQIPSPSDDYYPVKRYVRGKDWLASHWDVQAKTWRDFGTPQGPDHVRKQNGLFWVHAVTRNSDNEPVDWRMTRELAYYTGFATFPIPDTTIVTPQGPIVINFDFYEPLFCFPITRYAHEIKCETEGEEEEEGEEKPCFAIQEIVECKLEHQIDALNDRCPFGFLQISCRRARYSSSADGIALFRGRPRG